MGYQFGIQSIMMEDLFDVENSERGLDIGEYLNLDNSSFNSEGEIIAAVQKDNDSRKTFDDFYVRKIKNRRIKKDKDAREDLKGSIKNQNNLAKKLIPSFGMILNSILQQNDSRIQDFGGWDQISSTVHLIDKWRRQGADLNLTHLKILFGNPTPQSYFCAKALHYAITEHCLEIIHTGKIEKKLTYLFGTEKYASKLANFSVASRVQAK